jgi:hypothetical protein
MARKYRSILQCALYDIEGNGKKMSPPVRNGLNNPHHGRQFQSIVFY